MEISEHILRIKPYFQAFNMVNDTTFIFAKFPDVWKTFDEETLKDTYKVYIGKKDGGVYFVTETQNGTNCLFDAVEHVITINKSIEEKAKLLQEKANELKELFLNEPLEKLMTLKFVFEEEKKRVKKTSKVKEEQTEEAKENEELLVKPKAKQKIKDSDNMSFMKELTKAQ